MTVPNLQSWADYSETIRLPQIEQDVAGLQADQTSTSVLLTQKIQEFGDAFAAHLVSIGVAQDSADDATINATDALTQIYNTGLAAHTYTDQKFQQLLDTLNTSIDAKLATVTADLNTLVQTEVGGVTPTLTSQVNAAVSAAQTASAAATTASTNAQTAISDMLSNDLPTLQNTIDATTTAHANTQSILNDLTADLSFDSIAESLDFTLETATRNISPINGSVLREPRSLWGRDVHLAYGSLTKATLQMYGEFVEDDAQLAEAYYFEVGDDANIGPSYPTEFDPDDVYKVTVQAKALHNGDDGLGVLAHIGATVSEGTTVVEQNQQAAFSPAKLTIEDGVVRQTVYISGNQEKLTKFQIPVEQQIFLDGVENGNKLYIHVQQNEAGGSTGQLAVGSIFIMEVAAAVDGAIRIQDNLDTLTSDFGGLTTDWNNLTEGFTLGNLAELEVNYGLTQDALAQAEVIFQTANDITGLAALAGISTVAATGANFDFEKGLTGWGSSDTVEATAEIYQICEIGEVTYDDSGSLYRIAELLNSAAGNAQ